MGLEGEGHHWSTSGSWQGRSKSCQGRESAWQGGARGSKVNARVIVAEAKARATEEALSEAKDWALAMKEEA